MRKSKKTSTKSYRGTSGAMNVTKKQNKKMTTALDKMGPAIESINKRELQKRFTWERHQFQKTQEWKDFKEHLLETRGPFCHVCGREMDKGLAVHHAYHYENIDDYKDLWGHEKDLWLVCRQCHLLCDRTSKDRLYKIANRLMFMKLEDELNNNKGK